MNGTFHGLATRIVNLPGRHARSCVPARAGRPVLLPPNSEELITIITTVHPVAAFGNVLSCLLRPLENPKVVERPLAFPPANERVVVCAIYI